MRFSPGAPGALLNWVNNFPLENRVQRLEDLNDGVVLSQILQDMDAEYRPNPGDLNLAASSWLERKRNLEAVFKSLDRYVCRDRESEMDWLARSYRPKEIAESPDNNGMCEVLAVLLYAAMAGPQSSKYIPIIQTKVLETDQRLLAGIFKQKQQQQAKLAEAAKADDTIEGGRGLRDHDLELEEERATHRVQIDSLMKQNADLLTRLERLQEANEELKEADARFRAEVEEARKLHSGNHDAIIKRLEDRARELEDLIQQQEHQIEEDRLAKLRLTSENAQLSQLAEQTTALRDEVSELRHSNSELSKKANAAERYKQKLESQQGIEKDLKNVQYELEEARKDVASLEKHRSQLESQASTIVSYRRLQQETELSLNELREQKNGMQELLATKSQELERVLAQKSCDEKLIVELREQINSNGLVRRSPSPESRDPDSAGLRSPGADDATIALRIELNKLKAENALLRENVGSASANEHLRADLELSKRNEDRLTKKLHETRDRLAISEEQVQVAMNGFTDEGSQAYLDLHKMVQQRDADLARERERSRHFEADCNDAKRELLALRTDYKVATTGSNDALQELKKTDQLISASLRDELVSLRKAHEALQLDSSEQKTQLIEALVSREHLRKELEAAEAAAARGAATDVAPPAEVEQVTVGMNSAANDELTRKHADKVDKLRGKVQQMKEQLQKADQERYELQRRLKSAEQGGAYAALKAANEQTIKNLQRENAMISTAWYDLTSRLQSNHVVLQRRQDMPKSWLNKQRQMVNATPRR